MCVCRLIDHGEQLTTNEINTYCKSRYCIILKYSIFNKAFLFICLFSHNILCDVNFNTDQKNALIVPVKKEFGEIADWDENAIKEICKVLEVVPPTQLLKISAKAVLV